MYLKRNINLLLLIHICFIGFNSFAQSSVFCNNVDFEASSVGAYTTANAVSGWTISSQTATSCNTSSVWNSGSPEFSIVTTPMLYFPNIGTIINSPLGGNKVAILNDHSANANSTKLSRTFSVTATNSILAFAVAGYYQNGSHLCCEQAGFKVQLKDCQGNVLSCPNLTLNAGTNYCTYEVFTSTVTNSVKWLNWQVQYLDFTPYVGSCITIEIISNDCKSGDHVGLTLFDATCPSPFTGPCLCATSGTISMPINYCNGSSIANLYAPLGFVNYTWTAPPGYPISPSQTSLASISITNAVVNNVYTVSMIQPYTGCTYSLTGAIQNVSVAITGTGTSASCIGGASGSATVAVVGGYNQYNYQWVNSSNMVVSTNSVLTNALPGIYSVTISAPNYTNCGVAQTTLNIGTYTSSKISLYKPFCGTGAFFSTGGGTNHQWFLNNAAVSPSLGGTSPTFTISPAVQGSTVLLTYLSAQGCQDSIKYTLIASAPGSLSVSYPSIICSGSNNGQAIISLTPAIGSPSGLNYFLVNSAASIVPAYVSSVNPTAANAFTVNGLVGGASYVVQAFDGSCKYSSTFSTNVQPPFNFALSPLNATICSGNAIAAITSFSSNPPIGYYTYTWTPNIFLAGNNPSLQSTIIQPTANVGGSVNIIYTVAVTPTTAFCPQSKTISITYFNPITPTVTAPNQLICATGGTLQLNASPSGGTFFSNALNGQLPVGSTNGVLNPLFANHGINSFTYTIYQSTCSTSASTNFTVNKPMVNFPLSNAICAGKTLTIHLSGASSYSWNTGSNDSINIITPLNSTQYTVVATNTPGNCSSVHVITVNVNPNPSVTINATPILCIGDMYSLTAKGANTYTWSTGALGNTILLSANSNTNFAVIGTNTFGCIGTDTVAINVHTLPTISVLGQTTACAGEEIKLLAQGASNYMWNNVLTTDSILFIADHDSTIKLLGINEFGCRSSLLIPVKVNPLPQLQLHGNLDVCAGTLDTLSVSGAKQFTWSTGETTHEIVLQPMADSDLFVVGVSEKNCVGNLPFHITVREVPNLTVVGETSVCIGDTVRLTASGASYYSWSNSINEANNIFVPRGEIYVTVAGIAANNCVSEKFITLSGLNCDSLSRTYQLRIYPNPGNGKFTIEYTGELDLDIYDAIGQLIQQSHWFGPKNEVDLTSYANGVYVLRINGGEKRQLFKLIKTSSQ